ncbi:MAG: hypothetical protein AAFY60_05375, partial [Myxococcota bacterium]
LSIIAFAIWALVLQHLRPSWWDGDDRKLNPNHEGGGACDERREDQTQNADANQDPHDRFCEPVALGCDA